MLNFYFVCLIEQDVVFIKIGMSTTLYRPTGQIELDLVKESGFKKWPPRLPEQPIFYPVTNEGYAVQIARDWNTKGVTNGSVGYVTKFEVRQ